jgi:hypothetical protein
MRNRISAQVAAPIARLSTGSHSYLLALSAMWQEDHEAGTHARGGGGGFLVQAQPPVR